MSKSSNIEIIHAPVENVYKAFTDPAALEQWLVPGEMTGTIHRFELKVGGGYEMSLYYPASDQTTKGKTEEKEDRYTATFLEIIPNKKIVEAIRFTSPDPAFAGEMIMDIMLEAIGAQTKVTITCNSIPSGIRPEDNEEGTASSLEKLAILLERKV